MFKNWGLKFTALFLSIIFWVGVVSSKNNLKSLPESVPIKPFNIADNLTLAKGLGTVEIKLEAPQETYDNLSINDFEAYVDLKGLVSGDYNVPVQVTSKNPKVKVVRFEPNNLNIKIEEITSKNLNVSVEVKGNVADNFEAQEPIYQIKEVVIKGPKNLVEKVTEVKALLNLKGVEMSDIKSEVTLLAYDEKQNLLKDLQILPASLEVNIPIIQIQKYKTVGVRANLIGDLKESHSFIKKISLSPATVLVQGKAHSLQEIDYLQTEPIEISELTHNTLKRVELLLPEGVSSPEVETVLVTIEIAKIETTVSNEEVVLPVEEGTPVIETETSE